MKNILLLEILFLLAGCSFSFDKFDDVASDAKIKADQVVLSGRNTINDVRESALEVKEDIEKKIDDIDRAAQEIGEAKDAIDRIFNTSLPKNISSCTTDSDCVVVDYMGCCVNKTAIHKKFLSQYNDNSDWQKDSFDCSTVECSEISDFTESRCLADSSGIKKCTLISQ